MPESDRRQIVLTYGHDDQFWTASVPSLPGCLSQGHCSDEVILSATHAITRIAGAEKSGMSIPSSD